MLRNVANNALFPPVPATLEISLLTTIQVVSGPYGEDPEHF